jgi:glycosyltransferase involved in cell wall biosynthesis
VYNEAETLLDLLPRLNSFLKKEDVLIIDDGSEDTSSLMASRCGFRTVRNPKNLGKGRSLQIGFSWALEQGYDAVLTMDADCQHDPKFIPQMVEAISKNKADMVIGTRLLSSTTMPLQRIASNKLTSLVVSILGKHRVHDSQSGFRLTSTRLLRSITLKTERFETESELLIKSLKRGCRVQEIPIDTVYGEEESSIAGVADTLRFIVLAIKSLLGIYS